MKKEFNVYDSTLSYDNCVGCGICEAVCPHNAINMIYSKFKRHEPRINDNCTKCKICVAYCPHTKNEINKGIQKALNHHNPFTYGNSKQTYIAYDLDAKNRALSPSGGALNALAKEMMKRGVINYVIHANYKEGKIGEEHFEASISSSLDEIDEKRGSFYFPISFEKVLKFFQNKNEKILVIGVPCVVRGMKKLFSKNPLYKQNTIYTAALACSHNVSGAMGDYIAAHEKVDDKTPFFINFRSKNNIPDADHFRQHFYTLKDGLKKTISEEIRYANGFIQAWRGYYFSLNICFKCADFWGNEADICTKDAWGRWSKQSPLGHNVIFFKNKNLEEIFLNCDSIYKEKIDYNIVVRMQRDTALFKYRQIAYRTTQKPFSIKNIAQGYFKKYLISKISSHLFAKFGFKTTFYATRVFEAISNLLNALVPEKLLKVFSYDRYFPMQRIFIVGGYGYSNTGDEAQLNTTLKNLQSFFPNYIKIVGTHNRMHTLTNHGHKTLFDSPREAFFDHNQSSMYDLKTFGEKAHFWLNFMLIYLNAFLVRAELPTFFINAKKAALLNELKNCDLLFFSGGGYLTGDTLSRLHDGILMILIAKVFDIKVVLSGQTIGIWKNKFNAYLAKKAFSKVDLISTRDPSSSIKELAKIGVNDAIYTCDDALFCECDEAYENKFGSYIAFNIHYWGLNDDKDKEKYLKCVNDIINKIISKTDFNIVFIPMTPNADEIAMKDYLQKYPNEKVQIFKYNFNFKTIRSVIKNSQLCVSMKHHPIIFAMGEKVPVISLTYSEYYMHKNAGALELFEMKDFNVDLNESEFLAKFDEKFEYILKNKKQISQNTTKILDILKEKQDKFYEKTYEILGLERDYI
ncbi:polysaccharide pyruvyl transferase family protein [Campylobacter sputorum]|uniref:polysaccharide pyruvyl transferase family protein n=1 Tax=Campylobacter sputorum TaxID=206 RepID=UPI001E43CFF2|nr:polysaccharide pyruvyl transferase family protein [Campylobacter sputorum]